MIEIQSSQNHVLYCSEHCCAEKTMISSSIITHMEIFHIPEFIRKTTMLVIKSTLLYVLGHSNSLETRNVIKQTRSFILGIFGGVVN